MKIKKIFALLCASVVIATTSSVPTFAESTSYGNTTDLSPYGFVIDSSTYNKTCTAVKSTSYLYSTSSGNHVIDQTTRIFICREKKHIS